MKIEQFEDSYLSHFSYAILCEQSRQITLIDPSRDPSAYYAFADLHGADIVAVIETHSHADFVSSHHQISQQTGARIYMSQAAPAAFPFIGFDAGSTLHFEDFDLRALNTPGHSADSISVLLSRAGKDLALFSGDTLFIGDIGRPDLRESGDNTGILREDLARRMFNTIQNVILPLNDEIVLYPAHGAGSLCGKALEKANSSTIGKERRNNWALAMDSEELFVKELCNNQPFIPKYFPHAVAMNLAGAEMIETALARIPELSEAENMPALIVDVRREADFAKGHLSGALNIMDGTKFETWLGTMLAPDERFILTGYDAEQLNRLSRRLAAIGYENNIKGKLVAGGGKQTKPHLDLQHFKEQPDQYTIIDLRNRSERDARLIFPGSISIPLPELRERVHSIPANKPLVVHCAAGYRSALGSSVLAAALPSDIPVFDLGEEISQF